MTSLRLLQSIAIALTVNAAQPLSAQSDGLPPMMLLGSVPADAVEIVDAMRIAKPGQSIVIRGRITDGNDVFVGNRAIMRLADEAAMPACCAPGAHTTGGACTVPADRRVTVQFLDTRGRMIRLGLQGRHGLTIGKEVFIVGTVLTADNERTLIINASGMHVPHGDIPVGLMVDTAPEGALDVGAAKATAKVGERITLRGRVGGTAQPFVDGQATVEIVGRGVAVCADRDDHGCDTPWDCCGAPREEVLANAATIQVTDARGEPVRTDLRGRRNMRELSEITVTGTVISIEGGRLIVRADAIHVAPDVPSSETAAADGTD